EMGRTRMKDADSRFENGSTRFPRAPPANMATMSGVPSMMPKSRQLSSTFVRSIAGTKRKQGIKQAMKIGTIKWARHSYQSCARLRERNGWFAAHRRRAIHSTKRLQARQS